MEIEQVERKLENMHFDSIVKSYCNKVNDIKRLKTENKELNKQLRLHSVSNSIATEYAEFCVRCDREKLPLLCLEDYIKQYCG
jgi:hypothetical protein